MFRKLLNNKLLRIFKQNSLPILNLILILFHFIVVKFVVQYLPLKYYYSRFIKKSDVLVKDLQPYYSELRLIHRMKLIVPWKVTCLMESLIIQSYFKRYNYGIPILLGVHTRATIQAHALVFNEVPNDYTQINIENG